MFPPNKQRAKYARNMPQITYLNITAKDGREGLDPSCGRKLYLALVLYIVYV